jgi:hypothetical protein
VFVVHDPNVGQQPLLLSRVLLGRRAACTRCALTQFELPPSAP